MKDISWSESPEFLRIIEEIAIRRLTNCKAFRRFVGGKNFIKRQLRKNLNSVWITKENNQLGILGSYSIRAKMIQLYGVQESEEVDVEQESTRLHEAIHAILHTRVRKMEGTGINRINNFGEIIGIGLNEGLTEWILDKSGLKGDAYGKLKNIIEQLELYLGENQVMKFANGDIERQIPYMLNLSSSEFRRFLMQVDMLYNLEMLMKERQYIADYLNGKHSKEEMTEELIDAYMTEIKSKAYKDFLAENQAEASTDSELEYLKKRIEDITSDREQLVNEINLYIFEKYFEMELYELRDISILTPQEANRYIREI